MKNFNKQVLFLLVALIGLVSCTEKPIDPPAPKESAWVGKWVANNYTGKIVFDPDGRNVSSDLTTILPPAFFAQFAMDVAQDGEKLNLVVGPQAFTQIFPAVANEELTATEEKITLTKEVKEDLFIDFKITEPIPFSKILDMDQIDPGRREILEKTSITILKFKVRSYTIVATSTGEGKATMNIEYDTFPNVETDNHLVTLAISENLQSVKFNFDMVVNQQPK